VELLSHIHKRKKKNLKLEVYKKRDRRSLSSFLHIAQLRKYFRELLRRETRVFGNPSFIYDFDVATIHPS